MTLKIENNSEKLIHIGRILGKDGRWEYLYLRKVAEREFIWFRQNEAVEEKTSVSAETIEEAIRIAKVIWKNEYFNPINAGFRYTLPERDEHGINALFHQMVASYSSPNGVYYDDELGNNCFVQNASDEALKLWRKLKLA